MSQMNSSRWVGWLVALLVCLFFGLGARIALAQDTVAPAAAQKSVVIVGSDGAPVPFATIQNRNSGVAISADALGNAILPPAASRDTLVVRSLGHMDLVVPASRRIPEELRLVTDPISLEAVQVVSESASNDVMTAKISTLQLSSLTPVEPVQRIEVPQTSADLLWSTGSVLVQQSQQGGGSPIVRGFEANRVLLVIDGVRLNNAIYRSGHLQNAITIDPNILERTDVIMGPNSVVYGSDALGGVIHYRTRTPRFRTYKWKTRVTTAYRTPNQSSTLHADVEYGSNRFATLTSVTASRFGDLRMGTWRPHGNSTWGLDTLYAARIDGVDSLLVNEDPTLQVGSGYDQIDLLQKFRFNLGDAGNLGLNFQYSNSTNIPRYDVSADQSGGTLKWAEWDYGPQKRLMVSANYSLYANRLAGIQFQAITAYQQIEELRIQRRFGSDERETQHEIVDVWSGSLAATRGFRGKVFLSSGLDYSLNQVESLAERTHLMTAETEAISTRYPSGGSSMNMLGGFFSFRYNMRQRGEVTAGVRYSNNRLEAAFLPDPAYSLPFEQIESQKGAWTGGISARINATESWSFATSLSSGFRHPNIDDVGKVREKGGYVIVPNDSLRPEYLYSADQTIIWNLRGKGLLEVRATGFATLWKDAIVPMNAELGGDTMMWIDGDSARVQTNVNASSAVIRGARLTLAAQLFPKITLEGAINWTYGQERDTDSPLSHIPPTFGRVAVDYEHKWLTLVLHSQFSGFKPIERFGPGATDNPDLMLPEGAPAWWTLNLEGRFRLSDGFEIRLAGRNLLDQHYRVFASGISAPGRGLHASAHFMF